MLRFLGYIVAAIHGILLFHVLRVVFVERRQKKTFAGRDADPSEMAAWLKAHEWDFLPGLIAGLLGIGDALLMMVMLFEGPVLAFFSLLYGFIGLFFLAYFTFRVQKPVIDRDRSATAKTDVSSLSKGVPADLYGTWLVRGFREGDHDYVKSVEAVTLDPERRLLLVRVKLENWDESIMTARPRLFSFYQDILEFIIYLISAEWLGPYVPFYETIELTLLRDVQNESGRVSIIPFYRITARKEQARRARDRGCDPFHLERSFEVVFKGGAEV
jgi:hypothetical protein